LKAWNFAVTANKTMVTCLISAYFCKQLCMEKISLRHESICIYISFD
jgi:hypothetical protein